ncbi:MAG: ABC transporter permease, partial [Actinobacteria bacterium]
NTFVVGIALNVFVLGITSFLTETEKNHLDPRQAKTLKIPFFHDLDIVGKSIFTNRWPIYLLVIVIPLSWWIVQRTRWGLEVRASGEDPIAADVTGIDVNKRRRQTLYYCGLMSGLGGAYYALGEVGQFNTIFGGWTLFGTIGGCFLFGAADALRLALPALGYTITPQVLIAAPYVLALLAMLLFAKRARKPAALAQPFERSST